MIIENETIKDIASGNKDALSTLYDQVAPTLYGLALRITESREKADKVVQEVFRRIWRTASSFDPSYNNPFYWVIDIAKEVALENESRSDQFDFFAFQESNSVGHNLKNVIAQIDNKHRQVLELSFFRNMTEEEIEEEMNIPIGTVATRLRIAIKAMRAILD